MFEHGHQRCYCHPEAGYLCPFTDYEKWVVLHGLGVSVRASDWPYVVDANRVCHRKVVNEVAA